MGCVNDGIVHEYCTYSWFWAVFLEISLSAFFFSCLMFVHNTRGVRCHTNTRFKDVRHY